MAKRNRTGAALERTEGLAERESPRKTDPTLFWIALSSIAACLAAIFAGWGAWETRLSSVETAKATRASVWLQVLTEYASPEMLASMKELRAWQQKNPKDFDQKFKALLLSADKSKEEKQLADKLDFDRRRVPQFFGKIQVLSELRVIDEDVIGRTWSGGTYTYIAIVLTPLDKAKSAALFESKGITAQDKAAADRSMELTTAFYKRVFQK